ncbi:MAG TPA: TonB family protein [Candidatus Acidoferrales bacterium]|nr:TonB family protein [Candidatus Acidoferrales bacterium]
MGDSWRQWEGHVVNGEFHLRQYLGGSDHSAVFLTQRGEREPQKAAIKLIAADPGNEELQLSRWKLAAEVPHPHLIRLFEMGRCRLGEMRLLYVVMEDAEEDLSHVLPFRPLAPAEARDALLPVLDVLAHLHRQGLVHRHLKPANIMALDEQLKLSSDGICRVGESSGFPEKLGAYEPPEAAGGRASPAGDVWSLGVTLVEILTQHLPARQEGDPRKPVLPQTAPEVFQDIALGCLERDPARRCSIADIAARLDHTLPASPAPAHTQETTARPRKAFWKQRYAVPVAAVGLGLAAMLVGPKLLKRRPEAERSPETGKLSERAGTEMRRSPGKTPSPTSLRSETGTRAQKGHVVRGEALNRVLPDVPQKARDTIRGTVRVSVRVHVDRLGNVVGAAFDSPGPSRYFADLAMKAAQRWEFEPPKVDGRYVASEWALRFEFDRTATRAFPAQERP